MNTSSRIHANTRPTIANLDVRLLDVATGRLALLSVIADHDAPSEGRCPTCGWQTGRGQRSNCPSRTLARAVRDHRPVPPWLAHLVDDVPGASVPVPSVSKADQRAAEDALPGLFEPPPRQTTAGKGGAAA